MKKQAKRQPPAKRTPWPAVVYFWAFGLALVGYVVARVALDAFPHPYHWLGGLVGGLAGIPVGWLHFRRRGDLF